MAIVEAIPGIRRVINRTPDAPVERREGVSPVQMTRLQHGDIPELVSMLHRSLDATSGDFLAANTKEDHKNKRTIDYYTRMVNEPVQDGIVNAIFVARDTSGQLIGALETEQFAVDGCNIGFISWVTTDPTTRQGGVAREMYRQYEEQVREEGLTFLMANVHNSNEPSLNLHRSAGFRREPYLQKPAEANWYLKQINRLPQGAYIPITETSYLPPEAIAAMERIQPQVEGMNITYHDKEQDGERLVSVAVPHAEERKQLQTLFAREADIFAA
jgi:ribosomal protein S18 acetylase RimI-like enzyme